MALCLALVGGCILHRPSTPGEQLKDSLKGNDWGGKVGHLDGNLLGVNDHDEAKSAQIQVGSFTLLGLIGGELCFSYQAETRMFRDSPDEMAAGRMKFMKHSTWVFEAHDSEATIRDGWPDHSKSSVTSTTLQYNHIDDQSKWSDRLGHVETSIWVETRIENCGPAPVITPSTKFVTISWFGGSDTPALLVWKLDEPVNPDFLARQETDGAAEPSAEDPAAPDTAPEGGAEFQPGTESIMQVLAAAGDFRDFTALLAEVGLDKELATGGPYMVFAPTDAMLAKVADSSWRKNKKLLRESLEGQIVEGVVTADEHELPTLGGKTRTISFRDDGSIRVRGARGTITPVGAATNAMIYRVE